MQQKYKLLLSIIFLLLITSVFYFIFIKKEKEIVIPEEKIDIVIPARPSTFEEGAKSFIDTVKLARIANLKNEPKNTANYTDQSFILWRDVVNEFINTPSNTIAPDIWIKDLSKLFELIQEANILAKKSDMLALGEKLDESRIYLNSFYLDPEKNQTDNELFDLLLTTKEMSLVENLEKSKNILDELKLNYTKIKDITNNQEFQNLCQNFETALSEIDNATETTFRRAQAKIMPTFIAIYEKY